MLPGMQAAPAFLFDSFSSVAQQAVGRRVSVIVVHCSATPSGQPIDQHGRDAAHVIDAWHAERGFARDPGMVRVFNPTLRAIGYHFVIDLDGSVLTGRELCEVGAHAAGHNTGSVGICMVGGAEVDARFSRAQWAALARLVQVLAIQLNVPLRHVLGSGAGVCGHRDLSPDADGDGVIERREWLKTCPGFDVSAWLAAGLQAPARNVLDPEVPQ